MTGARPQPLRDGGSLRLDKFLWFARFARTRSLAAKLCASGSVTVNGAAAMRPSQAVRVGDIVSVPQGRLVHTVRIAALGARRGPPTEARQLYEVQAAPRPIALRQADWEPLLGEAVDECG
jgi:ribosome-associated heat shock protein Hsp15